MRTSRVSLVFGTVIATVLVACSSSAPVAQENTEKVTAGGKGGDVPGPVAAAAGASDAGAAPMAAPDLDQVPVIDGVVPVPATGTAGAGFEGFGAAGGAPVNVFLNRNGGSFVAGAQDDSAHGVSSVLQYYGRSTAQFPAARYSDADWQTIVACVKSEYTGINVAITDQKPAGGAYVQLNVGDTWADVIGLSNNIGGIAPLGTCAVVPQAVGYVFGKIYDQTGYGGLRGVCEGAAHEIGHTLSLSHESLQTDLMSYAAASAGKHFQNQASYCGTTPGAESCTCGAQTQDSHTQLLQIVGAQSTTPTPPTPPMMPPASGDTTPPTVTVVSPDDGSTLPPNSNIQIVVDATDDVKVAEVSLYWAFTNRTLACDNSVSGVTCTQTGNRSTWTLFAGSGARTFFAVATDSSGNKAQTPSRNITLGSGTPPPVDLPPTISPQYPAASMTYAQGDAVIFQAQVSDDHSVADVRAVWAYQGGSYEYVMVQSTTPGVYVARTTISTTAASGPRTVTIQATDSAGQRTVASPIMVQVQ